MEELWRDIEGYTGLYQVSSLGNVKSLKREFRSGKDYKIEKNYPEHFLKIRTYKTGYKYVGLSKDGDVKKFKVHRLVAKAFIVNPDNLPCVDHINGERGDNRVSNLRWSTASDNMRNPHTNEAIRKSKLGNLNPMKKKQRPVLQIDPRTGTVLCEFAGCKDASIQLGLDSGVLSRCCRSNSRRYKGFIYKYKDLWKQYSTTM